MKRTGEKLDDTRVMEKILRSLTHNFEHVVTAVEESKNLETISTEELLGSLRVHEQRILKNTQSTITTIEQMLESKLTLENSGGEREHGQGPSQRGGTSYRGRGRGRGNYSQTGNGRGRSNVRCFQCRKIRHYSSECPNKPENYANLAEASNDITEEPTLLLVHNDSVEQNNVWYLDSGASNHMCGRKEYFVNLKEETGGSVSLGDGSKLQVAGRGQIQIYQKDGQVRYISDVYYIPSMKNNILSLGQLLEKGDLFTWKIISSI